MKFYTPMFPSVYEIGSILIVINMLCNASGYNYYESQIIKLWFKPVSLS